jgi:membrane protein implicated in regulation of membrane protease activity
MAEYSWEIWGVLALVLLGGEIYTQAFVLLWPAIGAGAATIGAGVGLSIEGQFLLFSISSVALLAASRTIFWKLLSPQGRAITTNVEALPGKSVEVIEPVGGLAATGTVKLGGERWSAFTDDGSLLKAGELGLVVRVDGLKLCVRAAQSQSDEWKRRVP